MRSTKLAGMACGVWMILAGFAWLQQGTAQEATQRGFELLQQDQFEEALQEFERALGEDDTYWPAYLYRGQVLGLTGDDLGARDSFVEAVRLNPGHPQAHHLITIASIQLGDFDSAWKHAILAQQNGLDMADAFAALRDYSSEPEDLNERLSAPLVALVAPDTQNALRRLSEFEDPFASRARVTGEQVIDEVRPDLMEIVRLLSVGLEESAHFGFVQRPGPATYTMIIEVDELDRERPRGLAGYIRLRGGDDEVYRRALRLANINNTAALRTEIERQISYLENWILDPR